MQAAAPRPQYHSWQREHLWMALLALGFEAGAEAAAFGRTLAHVTFGVNMFDKPNKDASYVVFHFLFAKLDNVRCKEVFRFWPLDKKKDAEFRKAVCDWLKKISEDVGNGFPQVVASIFLSPGGPKFVHLLYHFARYVLLQHIKRDVDSGDSYIPDSLQCRIQDPQKAVARSKVARRRYLLTLQRENIVIGQYQKKSQLLVKHIRDLRSEYARLQTQYRALQKVEMNSCKWDSKIKEIRSMWDTVMRTMQAVDQEVEVVDSVLGVDVDQYCLDGSNVALNIPNVLVTRIEREMHMLQMENVYEAGKVNLVTVIQLLNEALKIVKLEHCHSGGEEIHVDLQYLATKLKFETEVLARLKHMRHKIKREDLVNINKSIADAERDWEKKWKRILGKSPFVIFKGLNPVLELQPPLDPFSFDPAAEEELSSSVFNQYPVTLPDSSNKNPDIKDKDYNDSFMSFMDDALFTPSRRKSLPFLNQVTPITRRMSLNEKEFHTPVVNVKDRLTHTTPNSAPQKWLDRSWRQTASGSLRHTPTPCKQDAMSAARMQLAQQVADYIVNESPRSVSGRGTELDDLIGMLSSDPFLSRKEIPRTPENLISDIRTSWRKAIQSDEFSSVSSPVEEPCMELPTEQESTHCSQVDLSMACFLSTSHVSEQNESPDKRVSASTGKPDMHQQVSFSKGTLPYLACDTNTAQEEFVQLMDHDIVKTSVSRPVEEKNQTFTFENQFSSKLMDNTMLICAPSQENASAQTTLSWNSSNIVDYSNSSDSHEVIQFGILHETLPEGVGNISLNSTTSAENSEADRDHKVPSNDPLLDNTECSWKTLQHKLDLHSIRTRYEALKRNFFTSLTDAENGEEQTPLRGVAKHKSESSLLTESGNLFSPIDKGLTEVMTPSPRGRKLSLPQLISFSPNNERLHAKATDETDVFHSQCATALNETFDFMDSVSDLQKSTVEGVGQLVKL
ncbi:HAUS augmin-like complex subunit 6 [Pseudophryne corroboree]|uniref:HAUS augmin-like complex subunit 6 n=1 Tax=Pseudophryne corroboree TaxID=495146 RepID=UPI003081612C